MTIYQAVILGIVQGVTEFLPISSSAHLILFPWLLGWKDPGLAFDAFLHLGTIVAVGAYFFGDFWRIFRAGIVSILERRLGFEAERYQFWMLVLGSIPAGVAGYFLHETVEAGLREPLVIAVSLSLVGFLLYWVDGKFPAMRRIEDLKFRDALWIGVAQAFAIIPGVSRSGATMTMGRFLGMNREASAKFSFLLSFPIITAAGIFKSRELWDQGAMEIPTSVLASGFVASVIFGLLGIHFLLSFLRVADFALLAWYRILLAGFVVLWSVTGGI